MVNREKGKKAIIFPGQGSQYPNMGLSLYQNYPGAKEIFDLVETVSGVELKKAIFDAQGLQLKNTAIQQLAILAVSLAAYQQVKNIIPEPLFLSGLSLGEYSCLYAGGVLSLEDLILLVKTRAQAMQKAAENNPSSMLAIIGANKKDLIQQEKKLGFYIANINAPAQVVVSVARQNKSQVKNDLEAAGFRVVELEVSGGFHSPFMNPAKEELEKIVNKLSFNDARIPIVSNVTASACQKASSLKDNLIKQLVNPVLWAEGVSYMVKNGVNHFYEIGPSRVLKGLMRKIDKKLKVTNIESKENINGL